MLRRREAPNQSNCYLFLDQFTNATRAAIGALPFRFGNARQNVLIESQAFGVNCITKHASARRRLHRTQQFLRETKQKKKQTNKSNLTVSVALAADEHFRSDASQNDRIILAEEACFELGMRIAIGRRGSS